MARSHCAQCAEWIPPDRYQRSIFCSPECQKIYHARIRLMTSRQAWYFSEEDFDEAVRVLDASDSFEIHESGIYDPEKPVNLESWKVLLGLDEE